jgi:hypothetical protein
MFIIHSEKKSEYSSTFYEICMKKIHDLFKEIFSAFNPIFIRKLS